MGSCAPSPSGEVLGKPQCGPAASDSLPQRPPGWWLALASGTQNLSLQDGGEHDSEQAWPET